MKVFNFLVIIFWSSFIFASGSDVQQKMKEAGTFYESGNYSEAETVYNQIIDEGYESSALYFNLANCYYRQNNIGLSVYYYEKAKRIDPFDEDIQYNAELAEFRIKNKPSVLPEFAFIILLKRFVRILPDDIWAVLSLLLFAGCLFIAYTYLKSITSRQKKVRFLFSAVTLFFSLMTFFFSQYEMKMLNSEDTGIVISDAVSAKSSPDDNATDLFTVYEGFKVTEENEVNGWAEIKLTDGKKAWIKKEHIKFL